MISELTVEELNAGLDAVAEELLGQTGIGVPPVDALAVAKRLGIVVAWDDRQCGRARYVRLHDRWSDHMKPTILVRPEPRFERWQWAIAHEIGEHAAYRVFARWGIDPRETVVGLREQTANQLACRLLLPTAWFVRDAMACGWDLPALKKRYDTASHELIARRMLECGQPIVISIFDCGRLSFRHGNLPGDAPPPSSVEMSCWRYAHLQARKRRICDGATTVQCWPVHENGWRREILRTEIAEWFS
jgi:hypothetical protein